MNRGLIQSIRFRCSFLRTLIALLYNVTNVTCKTFYITVANKIYLFQDIKNKLQNPY